MRLPTAGQIAGILHGWKSHLAKSDPIYAYRYAMTALLIYSGARASEILILNYSNFSVDAGAIFPVEFRSVYLPSHKRGAERTIALESLSLDRIFAAYLEHFPLRIDVPFFRNKDELNFGYKTVQRAVKFCSWGTISPHSLRHFFASQTYRFTNNILLVRYLLGHRDIRNTMIYTHLDSIESRHAASKLDELIRPEVTNSRQPDLFYAKADTPMCHDIAFGGDPDDESSFEPSVS